MTQNKILKSYNLDQIQEQNKKDQFRQEQIQELQLGAVLVIIGSVRAGAPKRRHNLR